MTNIMNMVSTLSRTTNSRRSAFVTRQVIREIQAMASTLSRRSAFETRQVVRKMQVMVSILSRRSAFERRQVIRRTWGGHDNMFFAVGACCPIPKEHRAVHTCKRAQICRLERTNLLQSVRICVLKSTSIKEQTEWDLQCAQDDLKIAEENAKYKDIIQMPEIDVYRHLPQKVKFCYKWGLEHTTAKWFVKIDDDSFVRDDKLSPYLVKSYNLLGKYVVIGNWQGNHTVKRSGKNAEYDYKPSTYPKFPLGSVGHVVSKGVASYIAENSDKLFNYQGEDTSIGIWLDESPFKFEVKWVVNRKNHFYAALGWLCTTIMAYPFCAIV
jgi:hypothetical protein